jgi:hypothetical protein
VLFGAMAVVMATSAPATAQGAPQGPSDGGVLTFDPAPAVDPDVLSPMALDKLRHAKRSRFVETPSSGVASALSGSRVDLELFSDVVVALDGDGRPVPGAEGSTTWSGSSADGDYATLTFVDGRTVGTAAVDGVVYDISPVPGGRLLIVEEGRKFPNELEPLGDQAVHGGAGHTDDDKETASAQPDGGPPPSTSSGPVVDVLTWYDTAARTYYGGDSEALTELTATVNEMNAAYDRSGVNQSVHSVGIEYVAYSGSAVSNTELTRWQAGADGFLDSVHVRRDQLAADLAALVTPLSDGCGIAYLGGPASGANGFSVTDPGCARGNLSYAHELGHNMGAGHGDPDGGGLFSYSNGYRDLVNDFRTIMAYDSASCPGGSCPRVGHFSSPTVFFNGHPTGSVTHDNARTISERAAITAAYRSAPSGVSGTVTSSGSGSAVGGAWVAVLRTSDFSIAAGAVADGSGNFEAPVAAGSYYLYVVDPSGAHTAGFHGAPATVTVTAGNTTDVDPQMVSLRGAVAGTVTEAGSGTPIGGAWVIGINATTGATQRGAVANGAGQYNIAGLAAGSYRPVFVDPTGAHASRYFPNSVDFLGATSLAVTAGASTAANVALPAQSTTPGPATLSGTVREAGTNATLAGVFVVALRASDFRNAGGAVTNGSGLYSLNVAAGDYKLAFIDSTGLHNMEWHDNQPNTGLATATSVTAPAVTDAALDANTGSMAGTITDDPSGNPLVGAWVVAIGPTGAIAGGAVTSGAGTYTIAGLPPGTYRATIVDPNGGRRQEYHNNSPDYAGSTPITVTAAGTATINAALAFAPPANDTFANAQVVTGASGTTTGSTVHAAKEPGEPNHGGNAGGGSIWYRWTAPSAGTATFTTCGSGFDTLLGAYTGTAVNSLTALAGNDDSCGIQSSVSFAVTAGVTYRVAVDGYDNARGAVTLNWSLA